MTLTDKIAAAVEALKAELQASEAGDPAPCRVLIGVSIDRTAEAVTRIYAEELADLKACVRDGIIRGQQDGETIGRLRTFAHVVGESDCAVGEGGCIRECSKLERLGCAVCTAFAALATPVMEGKAQNQRDVAPEAGGITASRPAADQCTTATDDAQRTGIGVVAEVCPACKDQPVLYMWDRPGGPLGNGYGACKTCGVTRYPKTITLPVATEEQLEYLAGLISTPIDLNTVIGPPLPARDAVLDQAANMVRDLARKCETEAFKAAYGFAVEAILFLKSNPARGGDRG